MTRRVALVGGGALVAAGFVLALLALAVPWAHYRLAVDVPVEGSDLQHSGGIAVFQLELGWWYVLALFGVLGLVAGAAAATGGSARAAGVAGLAVGVLCMLLASLVGARAAGASVDTVVSGLAMVDVRAARGPGVGYGIAAPLVLALGGALLSVRTQQN
ncbi:hypothetical protein RB614_21560 [Phytohabitans sp. ZYX-F-186]|uniref:ABC transporter permease n=1 Tax=Phytohabitans maris TaxID=3071409 RepID=A0ABU0ZL45_9ACTN|nr:hypothetical protein [Phytohabitans sp. ZYX-F-186]MDQ7907104.1 hypothetical protein [Phytohabitans sp. ZYX-F-186]